MEGPTLELGSMCLRQLVPDDAQALEPYFTDPELVRLLGLPGPRDERFLRSLIASAEKDPSAVYSAILWKGDVVGYTFMDQIDWGHRHAAETGVLIGPKSMWDVGLGRVAFGNMLIHAFDDLALHRASLAVLEENIRAIRSYEAMGFTKEGYRRDSLLLDSGWVGTVMMGVLNPELNRVVIAEAMERADLFSRTQDG